MKINKKKNEIISRYQNNLKRFKLCDFILLKKKK